MKPINLKLQGLHSYQNLQEVDFSKLCERGIFGIFGPTGSGKSTVLDAITLALFGTVARAPRNTQGTLNHNSDKIYVSFTFELNIGNISKRYTVERQFKKTSENTVQSGNCRLIEEDELGQRVLADKARDVDQAVIEILGLTADDFTRAVVLPQGKFVEFLSLQASDRRKMLQRLFNLEAYGDKLQEKVKKRIETTTGALDGIDREMQGLGDASETALESAKLALEKAEKVELQSKNDLEKAQKNHDDCKEIWQKQLELSSVIKDKKLLLEQESKMAEFEKELVRAEKAEAIRHLIEEQEHLDKLKSTQIKELAAAQEGFTKTEEQVKNLQDTFLDTQREWEEKQPLLIEKKTKLEAAKTLEEDIEALTVEGKEINKSKKICTIEIDELEKSCQDLKANRETKTNEQNRIKNLIKENTVASERRQQINKSYYVYTQYKDILDLKNNQFEKVQKEFQQAWKSLMRVALEGKSIIGSIKELEEIFKLININHRELGANLKVLKELKVDLENQLQNKERLSLASLLVESLIEDMPCPVCGSKEHPAPAQSDESMEEISVLKEKLVKCNESIDRISEELAVSTKSIYQLELSMDNLTAIQERLADKTAELDKTRGTIEVADIVNQWMKLDQAEKEADQIKTHLEKIEQELENTVGLLEKTESKLKIKQLQEAELNTNLNRLKTTYEQKKALLDTITAGVTAEKLLIQTNIEIDTLKDKKEKAKLNLDTSIEGKNQTEKELTTLEADFANIQHRLEVLKLKLLTGLRDQGFENELDARNSLRSVDICNELKERLQNYKKKLETLLEREKDLQKYLGQKTLSEHEWDTAQSQLKVSMEIYQKCLEEKGAAARVLQDIKNKHLRWQQLEEESGKLQKYENLLKDLKRVLTGNALVEFMAEEHLLNVARIASIRLGDLTNNRYNLEVDGDGGFIIRDDANGGFKRPVTSLSGGETFLVSFSLALALSSQIQLRGTYPLEFFFLDEGFGSLDQNLLEVVILALERLQMERLSIGVISHVQEMRDQMTRKLIVTPAQLGGEGSTLSLEIG